MRRRIGGLIVALLASSVAVTAQDTFQVDTSVDSRRIGLQDTLEYKIAVNGSGFTAVDPPDLTDLRDFEVLDGPRRVQRQSIVNGRFSAAVELLWTLGPKRTGRLTIPALQLRVDGKPFRTDPIDVQTVEGSVASRVPSGERRGETTGGEVLLVAETDRSNAYVGQQVQFTLKLLTQLAIQGMAYQTRPDFGGFWAEKEFDYIDEPPARIDGRQVEHDGAPFHEYVLARVALFPTASGTITIDPVNVQLRVRQDRNSRFGSFFFDRDTTVLRRSAPITLQVRPLPTQGRPDTFTGAVGEFELQVATDRPEGLVNDAVSLSVRIEGSGNVRAAGEPVLPPLGDFRPFDPTVTETQGFQDGRFHGTRTWEYVLVPLAPGEQSVPPIVFSFFDPKAGAYRTLRSDPIPLHIARGEGPEIPRGAGLTRRDVTAVRQDIHFIKPGEDGLPDRSAPLYRSGLYLALLGLPLFLNAALLAWRVRSDRLRGDLARRRSLGARREFRRLLREARTALEADDAVGFHASVARALTGLVADKSNLAAAGLTREGLREALEKAGVDPEVRADSEAILDACDAARFSATRTDRASMAALLTRAESAGAQLERLR